MRRLLKFFHTMGAVGFLGSMACLLVLSSVAPPRAALAGYAALRGAMATLATWLFLPSLGLSLVAGLLAIAVNRAYHNAGWAWIKLASGVLLFEFGLQGVQGPMQDEARESAAALAGQIAGKVADPTALAASLTSERAVLGVLLAVATANVVLGIWRPRLSRLPD